jgi:hypothetical protein
MKKALSNDTYVDLYYNDVYALEKSMIMMGSYEDYENQSDSYGSYIHSRTLLSHHIESNQTAIEIALILSRLKYEVFR